MHGSRLRRTGAHGFDSMPAARCAPGFRRFNSTSGQLLAVVRQPPLSRIYGVTAADCEARCNSSTDCNAAEFVYPSKCVLHRGCLERRHAAEPRSDIMHRWGPTWPLGVAPAEIHWTTNASLCIVAYRADVGWLRTIPGRLFDLVVYRKKDFSIPVPLDDPSMHGRSAASPQHVRAALSYLSRARGLGPSGFSRCGCC